MGMFDYLLCDYPLPARAEAKGLTYQTKDFDRLMDTIHIREDGSVWGEEYEYEDRSDPNATGLAALVGSLTRVNVRPKHLVDFTGTVNFYSSYGPADSKGWGEGWLEFSAVIQKGQVVDITLLEDKVPAVIAARERREALEQEVVNLDRPAPDGPSRL